jgi:broad specificity phosphatase PhoE
MATCNDTSITHPATLPTMGQEVPGKSTNADIDNNNNTDEGKVEDNNIEYHRPRTLYLVRHGEAVHNVLEDEAQQRAKEEALALNLSAHQTEALIEERRQAVLLDPSLRDAPLTDLGRQQARDCAQQLQQLIRDGIIKHAPSEAMVSPLSRTLETCQIMLHGLEPKIKQAHIRPEIQERQTQYPPDTPRRTSALVRYTEQMATSSRFVMGENYNATTATASPSSCCGSSSSSSSSSGGSGSTSDSSNQPHDGGDARTLARQETREMLRERAYSLLPLLLRMNHRRHWLIVSHKGYLRELERGLLELAPEDSPLFGNGELRVYKVVFSKGDRKLVSRERLV